MAKAHGFAVTGPLCRSGLDRSWQRICSRQRPPHRRRHVQYSVCPFADPFGPPLMEWIAWRRPLTDGHPEHGLAVTGRHRGVGTAV
jgi:hypothetical protein